jgi:hypothetical protein
MISIPKAAIDLAISVLAAITNEVLEARKRRLLPAANDESIGKHDRPS